MHCVVMSFDREKLTSETVSLQCLEYRPFWNCSKQWFQKFCTQWQVGNPSKPSGHYMYRQFNSQQFYVLPTQCIYVFCVDLRTNSDYFTVQHWLVGFYNWDGVCLPCGTFCIIRSAHTLLFITQTECVYCAVRTDCLIIFRRHDSPLHCPSHCHCCAIRTTKAVILLHCNCMIVTCHTSSPHLHFCLGR